MIKLAIAEIKAAAATTAPIIKRAIFSDDSLFFVIAVPLCCNILQHVLMCLSIVFEKIFDFLKKAYLE